MVGTWLGEICSCSTLTVLPGSAWVLLNKICQPLPTFFHISVVLLPLTVHPTKGRKAFVVATKATSLRASERTRTHAQCNRNNRHRLHGKEIKADGGSPWPNNGTEERRKGEAGRKGQGREKLGEYTQMTSAVGGGGGPQKNRQNNRGCLNLVHILVHIKDIRTTEGSYHISATKSKLFVDVICVCHAPKPKTGARNVAVKVAPFPETGRGVRCYDLSSLPAF